MEIEQAPLPEQAPDQPAKVELAAGPSLKVTIVPLAKFALHVPGQLMPAGVLVMVPVPVPERVTVSGKLLPPLELFKYAVSIAKSVHVLAQFVRLKLSDVMFGPV